MNAVRGDVALSLDGVAYPLRLTFGALAEIETGLGVASLAEIAVRLRTPSANDLVVIVAALLRGGGCEEASRRLHDAVIDPQAAARAIAAALSAAFR